VSKPRSAADATHALADLLTFLHVLPVPAHTVDGWIGLLHRQPVVGGDVFHLQIVASMQANDVRRICTFNADDFAIFPELEVVTP
jgi:hypothetical protein